jgi:hypothetical protein
MHLTIATHFCGGAFAGTKTSFSGELATCGMEKSEKTAPIHGNHLDNNCCNDEVLSFSVDNNFTTSSSTVLELYKSIQQAYYLPINIFYQSFSSQSSLFANVFPPGNHLPSAASIEEICVFRI